MSSLDPTRSFFPQYTKVLKESEEKINQISSDLDSGRISKLEAVKELKHLVNVCTPSPEMSLGSHTISMDQFDKAKLLRGKAQALIAKLS